MSLIHQDKIPAGIRSAFISKVIRVSNDLGVNPNWLMEVMNIETAGTFRSDITNSIGATGLIQFMPATATALGTSTAALRAMDAVEQLDWVKKYYWGYRARLTQFVDLYLATLFPAAMGRPDTFILQTSKLSASTIARANPLFDLNKDGQITVGEIRQKLLARIPQQWLAEFVKKKAVWGSGLLIGAAVSLGIWAYYRKRKRSDHGQKTKPAA